MKYLKILLSIVALLAGAVSAALTQGLLHVPPNYIGLVMAVGSAFGVLGIAPIVLSDAVAQAIRGVAIILAAIVAAHAGAVTSAPIDHPWLWLAIGEAAIILGVIGKSPIQHAEPLSAAAKLDQPPPAV